MNETKIITPTDLMTMPQEQFKTLQQDMFYWMLGGKLNWEIGDKQYDWEYFIDPISLNRVFRRTFIEEKI